MTGIVIPPPRLPRPGTRGPSTAPRHLATVTKVLVVVVVLVCLVWTTVAALFGAPGDTISEHVREYSYRSPMVPFGLGVLIGHWLARERARRRERPL